MTYKSELDIQIIYIEMDKMTLIDDKEEGIMVKLADSVYRPNTRKGN